MPRDFSSARSWVSACAAAGLSLAVLPIAMHAKAGHAVAADEIHYSYGNTPDRLVVDWRGSDRTLQFGLTTSYGFRARAKNPAIAPVDEAGPFREVVLHGLAPNTAYHYRIGSGPDHVLRTAPLGSFRWVDVGDTASTLCKPWVAQAHALIARLSPQFVTHGGDITEANACGPAAVHRYFVDQQVWSADAAFQPGWSNHEYGYPDAGAPAGTPRDSMANYKGRVAVTHGQSLPLNGTARVTPPGCPGPAAKTNGCPGEVGSVGAPATATAGTSSTWPTTCTASRCSRRSAG